MTAPAGAARFDRRVGPGDPDRAGMPDHRERFTSYYGRPIIKAPVWKWDIPAYLFTGGLAAGTALVAAASQLTDRPRLRVVSRASALGAIGASTYFLIHDLGRPERFHHMLRVAKPTSPMSMGTWILAAFGPAAGIAAAAELAPLLPRRGPLGWVGRALPVVGDAAGLAAGALAPALATYTGVLLADTAVPAWHDAHPQLPFVFAAGALASAAGITLLAAPPGEHPPARRLVFAAAATELTAVRKLVRMGLTGEPYRHGLAGRLIRGGRVMLAIGVAGSLLGRRSRAVSVVAGAACLASSALIRFGVFQAGLVSARDPRYTVVPQRERRERRTAGDPTAD
ncbi:polysulfide reductase NrfD [Micromonospora sp. NBC_01699]|uniref:NrfD/PsrC family molybdoenzyme membrane anchor subunit n=1 Tax=Micromonospora sp. NBC_01699 TaxID=2975984 RepID=UPI002E35A3D3|nr:NrfD/PsrC family molybdoenzyme membrane anchor subunit [Micromonospora sp. NBC_01699]